MREGIARYRDVWGGFQERSLEETTLVKEIKNSESQERESQESKPEDSIFLARKTRKETSKDLAEEREM